MGKELYYRGYCVQALEAMHKNYKYSKQVKMFGPKNKTQSLNLCLIFLSIKGKNCNNNRICKNP